MSNELIPFVFPDNGTDVRGAVGPDGELWVAGLCGEASRRAATEMGRR